MEVLVDVLTICISLGSLAVAVLALVKAWPINKLQASVLEMDSKIKKNELDKIAKDNIENCSIELSTVKFSSNDYRIRLWNSGNVDAYNINLEIEKDSGYLMVEEKLPWEKLNMNDSVDIKLLAVYSRKDKFAIDWNWENDKGEMFQQSKIVCF